MTYPTVSPELTLDFAKSEQLDPRITFSRSSSATYVGSDGLIKTAPDGVARFEYDSDGKCLGLLIEDSRTNYVTDNDQALGVQSNITVSQVPGPDGVSTSATRMTSVAAGNATARNATNRTIVWGSQAITTWSYFFKPVSIPDSVVYLGVVAGGGQGNVSVDYIDGTVVLNGSATDAGVYEVGNGWYRVWVTYSDALSNTAGMRLSVQFGATAAGQYMDVYGMQMEVGSFSTSHIPTAGSTVTRAADVTSIEGSNFSGWYNQGEGSIVFDSTPLSSTSTDSTNGSSVFISDNWVTNMIAVYNDTRSTAGGTSTVYVSGSPQFDSGLMGSGIKRRAVALAYQVNNFAASAEGLTAVTDTSGALPAVDRMKIGVYPPTTPDYFANGHISRFTYYSERVSDESLEALTA